MTDELHDINLLKAFQQHDVHAERVVFNRLYRPLYAYARDLTHDPVIAEDIVSEAVFKGWARRGDYNTFLHLQRTLYRIVHNASVDHIRKEKKQMARSQLHYLHFDETLSDQVQDIEVMQANLLQEIYAEIEQLPDRCGQIFKLIFFEGLSTEQIAQQLSLNVQTVRTQKARALQLLRTQLLKKNRIITLLLLYTLLEKI